MAEGTEPDALNRERLGEWRTEEWLAERVRLLWEMHFKDVASGYRITTRFGSRARLRFGSIGARDGVTLITVNRLFADPYVPVFVVDATLVHELAHYAHGFGSGLPRIHNHAHRGGVVDKELDKRGLTDLSARAAQWRAAFWEGFYLRSCEDIAGRRQERDAAEERAWSSWLEAAGRRRERELSVILIRLAPRLRVDPGTDNLFRVEWLRASARQASLSYWFLREHTVRLHGLLADRRVPDAVVEFELAYWLARLSVGEQWQAIQAALARAGLADGGQRALEWRRRSWTAFRNRHHPLRGGPAR